MSIRAYFESRARKGTWSSLYDGRVDPRTYNFLTRREAVLRLLEHDGTFERILDIGCGTGDYAPVAARHHSSYSGIDFSWTMIQQATQRIDGQGTHHLALVGSGEHLPYRDNSFDLALAIGYIEYFRDPTGTLGEIRRILKPRGILIMQSYLRGLADTMCEPVVRPLRTIYRRLVPQPDPPLEVDQPYSQRQLDGVLRPYGFVRTASTFNHFCVFPAFMRSRLPGWSIRLSEAMARSHPAWWRFLAVNYIGKYRLMKSEAEAARNRHEQVLAS